MGLKHPRRLSLAFLSVAAAAVLLWGGAGAGTTGGGGAPPASPGRRVRVKEVLVDPRSRQPVVVLEAVEGGTLLPIWIGPAEARAIMMALRGVIPPRPMTHDLLRNVIGGLHGKVARVVITALKAGTFYALIELRSAERAFLIDSRPSDAIALALRTKAPIFVRAAVLETGITPGTPPKLTHRAGLGLVLQEMTPELARFFGGGLGEGLLVAQVRKGAPADRAGLRRGDVIFRVGEEKVTSLGAFEKAYLRHPGRMTVWVRRGKQARPLRLVIQGGGGAGKKESGG